MHLTLLWATSNSGVWLEGVSLFNLTLLDVLRFCINTPPLNYATFAFILTLLLVHPRPLPLSAAATALASVVAYTEVSFSTPPSITSLEGVNVLLYNSLSALHPVLLYVSVSYIFYLLLLRFNDLKVLWFGYMRRTLPLYTFSSTTTLVLGAWWAFQESSWGGFWVWEISEFLLLIISGVFTALLHFCCTNSRTTWLATLTLCGILCIVLVWYLTKLEFVTTLHTFFEMKSSTLDNFSLLISPFFVGLTALTKLSRISLPSSPPSSTGGNLSWLSGTVLFAYSVLVYLATPLLTFFYANATLFGMAMVAGYSRTYLYKLHLVLLMCLGVQILWLVNSSILTFASPPIFYLWENGAVFFLDRLGAPHPLTSSLYVRWPGFNTSIRYMGGYLHAKTYAYIEFLFI